MDVGFCQMSKLLLSPSNEVFILNWNCVIIDLCCISDFSYLYVYQIPFTVIATKTDKLSKSELNKNLLLIAQKS